MAKIQQPKLQGKPGYGYDPIKSNTEYQNSLQERYNTAIDNLNNASQIYSNATGEPAQTYVKQDITNLSSDQKEKAIVNANNLTQTITEQTNNLQDYGSTTPSTVAIDTKTGIPVNNNSSTNAYTFDENAYEGWSEIQSALDAVLLNPPTFDPSSADKWTGYINQIEKPYEDQLREQLKSEWARLFPQGGGSTQFQERQDKVWASQAAKKAAQALGLAQDDYNTNLGRYNKALDTKLRMGEFKTAVNQAGKTQEMENAWKLIARNWNVADDITSRNRYLEDAARTESLTREYLDALKNQKQPGLLDYIQQGVGQMLPLVGYNYLTRTPGQKTTPAPYSPGGNLNASGYPIY